MKRRLAHLKMQKSDKKMKKTITHTSHVCTIVQAADAPCLSRFPLAFRGMNKPRCVTYLY